MRANTVTSLVQHRIIFCPGLKNISSELEIFHLQQQRRRKPLAEGDWKQLRRMGDSRRSLARRIDRSVLTPDRGVTPPLSWYASWCSSWSCCGVFCYLTPSSCSTPGLCSILHDFAAYKSTLCSEHYDKTNILADTACNFHAAKVKNANVVNNLQSKCV